MADKSAHRVYWDADAFIGFLKGDKASDCAKVVKAATEGKIEIWSSSIVQVEALHLGRKNGNAIPKEDQEKIRTFFDQPYVILVNADREICRDAQEFFWKKPSLGWKDSIHIASARRHNIPVIHTNDKGLLSLSGQVGGNPPIQIVKPGIAKGPLFDGGDNAE